MKIIVTTREGGVLPLDVSDELPVGDLKALLEMEVGILVGEMLVIHNMVPLRHDDKMLKSCNVQEGDVLLALRVDPTNTQQDVPSSADRQQPSGTGSHSAAGPYSETTGMQIPDIDWSAVQVPGYGTSARALAPRLQPPPPPPPPQATPHPSATDNVQSLVQHFLANPEELGALQQRNPELAEALMSGDYNWMSNALTRYREQITEEERQRDELAGLDPWSEEYQQRLAENIRQRNIRDNLETALEHNPEIFIGRVHMLYIACKVNGKVVKALVDSGAQMTVMNVHCAQRCNIMRLVDRRYASYAFGVGRQRILGIIHLGQIQIGEDFLASSFRVLEDQSHELILGLDMLKRHQCCIDLKSGVLRIGTTGKETPFLPESEVPKTVYDKEEKGVLEDEDHEMASAIAKSEAEYKDKTGELPPLSPNSHQPPNVSEDLIQQVMAAGFKREEAIDELRRFDGDPDKAKASLFAKLFKL